MNPLPNIWDLPPLGIRWIFHRWQIAEIRIAYWFAAIKMPRGIDRAFAPSGLAHRERGVCEMLDDEKSEIRR